MTTQAQKPASNTRLNLETINDLLTNKCNHPACSNVVDSFASGRPKLFCSNACRQSYYRLQKNGYQNIRVSKRYETQALDSFVPDSKRYETQALDSLVSDPKRYETIRGQPYSFYESQLNSLLRQGMHQNLSLFVHQSKWVGVIELIRAIFWNSFEFTDQESDLFARLFYSVPESAFLHPRVLLDTEL